METIEFIRKFETENDVASISVNNFQVWSFLRNAYFFAFRNKQYERAKPDNAHNYEEDKAQKIRKFFYGFTKLFGKYDYIVFSDTFEIRNIQNKYVNKLANTLIFELGAGKTLLIENPAGNPHIEHSRLLHKNVISLNLFSKMSHLIPASRKFTIKNEALLKNMNDELELNVDYHSLISQYFRYRWIFKTFIKMCKPRLVFISDYYHLAHQTVIGICKELGIKTIELQHGVINKNHPAYNVFAKLDRTFFPDYLFAFGDYVKDIFAKNNCFIAPQNVFSIGSSYLDFINNEYTPSDDTIRMFSEFREHYKKIVVVSSQNNVEHKLIPFLIKSAAMSKDILFVFVPRNIRKSYMGSEFPKNIKIIKELDVYQLIREADFHSTVYSTCALEAPAIGTPNILINIDNLAMQYYSDLLTNPDVTRFVESEEQFVGLTLSWQTVPKSKIRELHAKFYHHNHKEAVKAALKEIEKIQENKK